MKLYKGDDNVIILTKLINGANNNNIVAGIHYMPAMLMSELNKTQEELEQMGYIFVEELPQEDTPANHFSKLFYNPETKELWYEYEELPPPEPDEKDVKINALEAKVDNLELQLEEKEMTLMIAIAEAYEASIGGGN